MAVVKTDILTEAGHKVVTWAGFVTSGDTGSSAGVGEFPDKTVQVFGSFGTDGAITIEGTNDTAESVWGTLHDPQGNTIVLTDSSVKLIAENPLRVRARASAGSGASMTVVIVGAR